MMAPKLALLALTLFGVCAAAYNATDSFSSYAEGSHGSPAWLPHSINFRVHGGSYWYSSAAGSGKSHSEHSVVPISNEVSIEATVTVTNRTSSDSQWSVAGISIFLDDENYWSMHIAEFPVTGVATPRKHFIEFEEMYRGSWLSAGGHSTVTQWQSFSEWSYNVKYRLRLSLVPNPTAPTGGYAVITATWSTAAGARLGTISRTITSPNAVLAGRTAFSVGGFDASLDDVISTWDHEAAVAPDAPPFTSIGKCTGGPSGLTATGFFRVEKVGSKWWFVDPKGEATILTGVGSASYYGMWCEALGRSPYNDAVIAKFGDNETAWAETQAARLKSWGFNSIALSSTSLSYRGLAHSIGHDSSAFTTSVSAITPKTTWTGFPDVFHPEWVEFLEITFSDAARYKDDQWVYGHFFDNEIEWWGAPTWTCWSKWCMFNQVWSLPATHTAKQRWVKFLGDTIPSASFSATFEANWNVSGIPAATDLLANTNPVKPVTEAGIQIAVDFLRLVAETYFQTVSSAIHKADPNHMYLCNRFPGVAPPLIGDIIDKYCDVITYNFYPTISPISGVPAQVIDELDGWHRNSPNKPIMITEWSFPALDAGLPSKHGAGMRVDTQQQRSMCYKHLQTAFMATDYIVGNMFFMFSDEPALGVSSTFPEDSNYGLVDVNDNPWPLTSDACALVNPRACNIHSASDIPLVQWLHQPWVDGGGSSVASYTSPARGLKANVGSDATVHLTWNDKPLAKVYLGFYGTKSGSTAPQYLGVYGPSLVGTMTDTNGKAVTFDFRYTSGEKINVTLRVVLALGSSSYTQPWAAIRLLSVYNGATYSFMPYLTSIGIRSEIGDDLQANDVAGTPAPFTNYWQYGSSFYDSATKNGYGTWWMGDRIGKWVETSPSPLGGFTEQKYGNAAPLVNPGATWTPSGGYFENLFVFPFSFSGSDDWTAANAARVRVQNEAAIYTATIDQESESKMATPSDSVHNVSGAASSVASAIFIVAVTLCLML